MEHCCDELAFFQGHSSDTNTIVPRLTSPTPRSKQLAVPTNNLSALESTVVGFFVHRRRPLAPLLSIPFIFMLLISSSFAFPPLKPYTIPRPTIIYFPHSPPYHQQSPNYSHQYPSKSPEPSPVPVSTSPDSAPPAPVAPHASTC